MSALNFEEKYFQKMQFTSGQVKQYFASAARDLDIAWKSDFSEVKFRFAYDALIKTGIALIAQKGYKVRSQPGHHIKIIEKMSEILIDENIAVLGNKMRQDRNADLYEAGLEISEKESHQALEFAQAVNDACKKSR